jgi:hypothetical protein
MIIRLSPKKAIAKIESGYCSEPESLTYTSIDEDGSFTTIDGGVMTQDEVNHAVDKGSGIFIGNYFVGIIETYQCYANSPFGRFS